MESKTKLYVTEMFDDDLIVILKRIVILTLNKPAYVRLK